MIPLALLLYALGMPWQSGGGLNVAFSTDPDPTPGYVTYAVPCHRDFLRFEGNSQYLCKGVPDGTIIIYRASMTSLALLRNVLAHEPYHLAHRDGLHEAEASAAGCAASYVEGLCPGSHPDEAAVIVKEGQP